jgi:aldehyde dehydrogenase (NAD+)
MMQETPTISSNQAAGDSQSKADRRLLIDGQLLETARTFPSINPATGAVLGHAPDATVADAEAAIAAARRAFDSTDWLTNTELRIRCLQQFHQALIDHRDELAALTTAEVGATPALIAGAQLDQPIAIVRYYAELLKNYPMTEDLGNIESRGMQHHRWVEKEAAGVVAAIIAYNYPNQLALAKLAPALAAGCTVILKAAPDTPLITLALGELIANHTDIPAGVVNVLSGADPEVGAELTTSPDVDMVTFTGSTPTGRRIMSAASDTLKRVFLELGGKSAAIVLDDADFNTAALFSAFSMVTHAGQGCALTSRLLVPRKSHDEIVELIKNNFRLVRYGDPADPKTYMGPLISEKQRDKVDGMVKRAVEAGATLVTGGEKIDPGYFYTPTLLTDVDPDSEIAQEEVFGPVLVVIAYEDDDDAVRIANNSIYGLSGAVFGSQDRALALARRIRTGTFSINGGNYFSPDSPFGGYKQSGIGREMGTAGLEEFLESKTFATVVDEPLARRAEGVDEPLARRAEGVDERLARREEGVDEPLARRAEGVDERLARREEGSA